MMHKQKEKYVNKYIGIWMRPVIMLVNEILITYRHVYVRSSYGKIVHRTILYEWIEIKQMLY